MPWRTTQTYRYEGRGSSGRAETQSTASTFLVPWWLQERSEYHVLDLKYPWTVVEAKHFYFILERLARWYQSFSSSKCGKNLFPLLYIHAANCREMNIYPWLLQSKCWVFMSKEYLYFEKRIESRDNSNETLRILHRCVIKLDSTMCKLCWCKCDADGFSVLISCTNYQAKECTSEMNRSLRLADPEAWYRLGM